MMKSGLYLVSLASLLILGVMITVSGCFRTTLVVVRGGADYLYPIVKGKGTVVEKTTYMEDGKYADIKTVITITGEDVTVDETITSKQGDIPSDEQDND